MFLLENPENSIYFFFAGGFLVTVIFGTGLSLAQISQEWIMMLTEFS